MKSSVLASCLRCPPQLPFSCMHLLIASLQSMIQLSRTQDEEVGDGTTSVIILGEHQKGYCSLSTGCGTHSLY